VSAFASRVAGIDYFGVARRRVALLTCSIVRLAVFRFGSQAGLDLSSLMIGRDRRNSAGSGRYGPDVDFADGGKMRVRGSLFALGLAFHEEV
jgi:hypothetical protein